jgi:threonine/homoserine/homoserine lactone efflux protein
LNFPGSEARNRENSTGKNYGASYRQGLTVNLLNPAITTFYIAVVPSFMPEQAPWGYYGMLAAAHVALAFASHTMWLLAFDRLRKLMEGPAMTRALDLVTAGVLMALAVKVLAD